MKKTGLVLAILVALTSACSPRPPMRHGGAPSASLADRESNATVVLLSADRHRADCSAVTTRSGSGPTVLITAAHCVEHVIDPTDQSPYAERTASVGDVIIYVPRREWQKPEANPGRASDSTIVYYNQREDRATLLPAPGADVPNPLQVSALCERCTLDGYAVHVTSALFGWETRLGQITGRHMSGETPLWATSVTIQPGWSGSPVFNQDGHVVGVISGCIAGKTSIRLAGSCEPGQSFFAGVE